MRTSAAAVKRAALPVLAIALLMVGACASTPRWYNPAKTAEQQARDFASCRYQADKTVEREYERDPVFSDPAAATRDGYRESMTRYDASKRRTGLINHCMRSRGYRNKPSR